MEPEKHLQSPCVCQTHGADQTDVHTACWFRTNGSRLNAGTDCAEDPPTFSTSCLDSIIFSSIPSPARSFASRWGFLSFFHFACHTLVWLFADHLNRTGLLLARSGCISWESDWVPDLGSRCFTIREIQVTSHVAILHSSRLLLRVPFPHGFYIGNNNNNNKKINCTYSHKANMSMIQTCQHIKFAVLLKAWRRATSFFNENSAQ